MFFLDDNTWVLESTDYLKITHDQGRTWASRFCQVCSNNWLYDKNNNEIIIYTDQDLKIERLIDGIPKEPIIFGNTNSVKEVIEDYFIPIDMFTSTIWELDSGGQIISEPHIQAYTIKVKWKENGEHILKAKRTNSCGESQTYELKINIGSLNANGGPFHAMKVFPNPFGDQLNISTTGAVDAVYAIEIYSLDGKMIKNANVQLKENQIDVSNLNYLTTGIYFLRVIDKNNNIQIFKLMKK